MAASPVLRIATEKETYPKIDFSSPYTFPIMAEFSTVVCVPDMSSITTPRDDDHK